MPSKQEQRKLRDVPFEELKLGDEILLPRFSRHSKSMLPCCISEFYVKSRWFVVARNIHGIGEIALIEYDRLRDPSYFVFEAVYLGQNSAPTTKE